MTDILMFIVAVFVSALDPLRLLVCIPAGIYIRKPGVAVCVGVLWALLLQVLVVLPAAKAYQSNVSLRSSVATIFSAVLVTLLTFAIAAKIRSNKKAVPPSANEQPPEDQGK
jgi:hypothetical protein